MMVNIIYPNNEISRIMTAAVVNLRFRQALLANPLLAIKNGYGDEHFDLEDEQIKRLAKIHAVSLEDFATKVVFS